MPPIFVMTSSWWLASPPIDAWRLIADAAGWPRWWRAVGDVACTLKHGGSPQAGIAVPGFGWRALAGARLRLHVLSVLGEPGTPIESRVLGDLQARATWLFAPAHADGAEITCRWEVQVPHDRGGLWGVVAQVVFEHRHFSRMQGCASGMGEALGCHVLAVRTWSGARRH